MSEVCVWGECPAQNNGDDLFTLVKYITIMMNETISIQSLTPQPSVRVSPRKKEKAIESHTVQDGKPDDIPPDYLQWQKLLI